MESLAKLVALMVLTALLSAPIAILITLIQRKSTNLAVIVLRRILQGVFLALSLFFGLFFFFNLQMPLVIHAIGLYALVLTYIAIRREYFPDVRIIAPLLAKFGVTLWKKQKRSGNERGSSHFGPVVKWRRGGRSGENDGHGPEGQH